LKDDMVAFIEGHGMRRLPGYVTEDIPSILWEDHGNIDAWKDFVEVGNVGIEESMRGVRVCDAPRHQQFGDDLRDPRRLRQC